MARTPKKVKRGMKNPALVPCYKLSEVKRLVRAGKYDVTGKALRTAYEDFSWGKQEISRFYLSLKHSHFLKKAAADKWDADYLDMYRAEMYGQTVYTHFFISRNGELVIVNSFKQDTSGAT